jgi:hypothetical protein
MGNWLPHALDKWNYHRKIALEVLEEVKISGYTGTNEEMDLVRLLFESSNSINRATLKSRCKEAPPSSSFDTADWGGRWG